MQAEPLHGPQLNLEEGFDLINTGERPLKCLGEGKKIWVEEMGALKWEPYNGSLPMGALEWDHILTLPSVTCEVTPKNAWVGACLGT